MSFVIKKFYTPSCGPCKMMAPMIEEIGEALGIEVISIDSSLDENQLINEEYGVSSVPTVILEDDKGILLDAFVGYRPKEFIEEMIRAKIETH